MSLTAETKSLIRELQTPGRRFAVAEAKELIDDIFDNHMIDTEDRFHSWFFYEICPLVTIADSIKNEVLELAFTGTEEDFDGILYLRRGGQIQMIEVSAAIDGHNDALMMELLKSRGRAPALQKIEASGTKRNRVFGENRLEAISVDESNAETMRLLQESLERKLAKSITNQDYTGAWLALVFDDFIVHEPERKMQRFDPLSKRLMDQGRDSISPFSRLFCVGSSRNYIFDSDS